MPYCTQQHLIDRFGESELIDATDRDRTGSVDQGVLDGAIADADADIDRHLRARYITPVQGSTELVRIACDLTRYYLWGIAAPEHIETRYKAAIATLRDYARGVIALDAATVTEAENGPRSPAVVAQAQVFTTDQLAKIGLK